MIRVTLDRRWLRARLVRPMRVLSWAPFGAGWRETDLVLWREVADRDLAPEVDALRWLAERVPEQRAVAMMTSCDISDWQEARVTVEGVTAHCVVTLGLTNAESVGARLGRVAFGYGTINLLVATDAPLSRTGQIEAMSIAVQARTAALLEHDIPLPTGRVTGTGTDCLALACPPGGRQRHAGLHTAVGEALGAAVRTTVSRAAERWLAGRGIGPGPDGGRKNTP